MLFRQHLSATGSSSVRLRDINVWRVKVPVPKRPGYLWANECRRSIGTTEARDGLQRERALVVNIWQDFEDRQAYKNISGPWYLFVAN